MRTIVCRFGVCNYHTGTRRIAYLTPEVFGNSDRSNSFSIDSSRPFDSRNRDQIETDCDHQRHLYMCPLRLPNQPSSRTLLNVSVAEVTVVLATTSTRFNNP
jgi:hypothetical protein